MPNTKAAFFLVSLFGLTQGCMKPKAPETGNLAAFNVDPPTPPLTSSCGTSDLAGCDDARALEQSIATMVALHDAQMAEMASALSSLQGVLSRPDTTPTANIQATPLETKDWVDIEAEYPADLVVRFESQRGLAYMGSNSVNDMNGALANLEKIAKQHQEQWDSTLSEQPRGLVLPKDLLEERIPAKVQANLTESDYTFDVPLHLGKAYIKRSVAPWRALAAHVISEPGMQYEVLEQHTLTIDDAVAVAGNGPFSITERDPYKAKNTVTSTILPTDVCDTLRGELRFVRAGQPVPVRAAFRVATNEGGAK